MIPEEQNNETPSVSQADFRELMAEKMRAAVRLTLISILETELEEYVGAGRYERTGTRRDHRIGHRTRDLGTSLGVIENLPVPRTDMASRRKYSRNTSVDKHSWIKLSVRCS